jgi:hypothetical protein
MATVEVERLRLQAGDLPPICLKTGGPADGTVCVEFATLPAWTYLLLLAGVFPFLIAVVFANERIVARVPLHRPVLHRYHDLTTRARLTFGVAVVCGVAAVVSGLSWLWWLAVPAGIAGVAVLLQRETAWVRVRPIVGTSLVALDGVHADFATAVVRQHASI